MAEDVPQPPSTSGAGPTSGARRLLAVLCFVLALATVPHRVCEREASAIFDGEAGAIDPLARSVAAWSSLPLTASTFATGSSRYDGEWLFGTYMMAAMGFGQLARAQAEAYPPESNVVAIANMERCLDAMLAAPARAFDRQAWDEDALDSLSAPPGSAKDAGHAAYLGYAGLALGLHRTLVARSRYADMHEALAIALARRIEASEAGFIETYPGEVYPVDNAAALGAIALLAEANHGTAPAGLGRGLEAIRARAIDPSTGLLAQSIDRRGLARGDRGRGSGTALGAYFLAYANRDLARGLAGAVRRELFRTVLGFGVVLENPPGAASHVDIDSGPVVFGFGVSATGFALGATRVNDDAEAFRALYATTHLFGAPFDEGGVRTYATGGPLGDALLFAMLTAPRGRSS